MTLLLILLAMIGLHLDARGWVTLLLIFGFVDANALRAYWLKRNTKRSM